MQEKNTTYGPTREEGIKGRNETRLALWEGHLKDPIVALDKALKSVEISIESFGPSAGRKMRSPVADDGLRRSLGEKPISEGVLALLGCDGCCVFAHSLHGMECVREERAAWRALFLPGSEGASDGAGQ